MYVVDPFVLDIFVAPSDPGDYCVTTTGFPMTAAVTDDMRCFTVTSPCDLSLDVDAQPTSCSLDNGSAMASGQGGQSPYSYEWSDGSTGEMVGGLSSGNYSVTVTDDLACTAEANFTISGGVDDMLPDVAINFQPTNIVLDPCSPDTTTTIAFEVIVMDNCDGSLEFGPSVIPGAQFAATIAPPISGGLSLASPGSDTLVGVFGSGSYAIRVSAEDAAGNTRIVDAAFDVSKDDPPPTNLICNYNVDVVLDANCQRPITADMVLEGDFGCASVSDFQVNITNDDDPSNGAILDGVGQFIYEVTCTGSICSSGQFPPFNWEDCWGYVTGIDDSPPAITCPPDTDRGVQTVSGQVLDEQLLPSQGSVNLSAYSCNGWVPAPGSHRYRLDTFQVSQAGFYHFALETDWGGSFASIYQSTFDETDPCSQLVAYASFSGNSNPNAPDILMHPWLLPGRTYLLLTTDGASGGSGLYSYTVYEEAGGQVRNGTGGLFPTVSQPLSFPLYCGDQGQSTIDPAFTGEIGYDGCAMIVSSNFSDNVSVPDPPDCGDIQIMRSITVTDELGGEYFCTGILLTLARPPLAVVQAPPFFNTLSCQEISGGLALLPNGNPAPSVTGYPSLATMDGVESLASDYCNIGASFVDRAPDTLGNGDIQFQRDWGVPDWCTQNSYVLFSQIITMENCLASDLQAECPSDTTYYSSPFFCAASFEAPLPDVTASCPNWEVATEVLAVNGADTAILAAIAWDAQDRNVFNIPVGNYLFRYFVTDDCGGALTLYCPFEVGDLAAPSAICDDDLMVTIGAQPADSRVYAEDANEGSNDNCGIAFLEIRRNGTDPANSTCGIGFSNWGPYIDFFCCDAGKTVTLELRAIDTAGNVNICWLDVIPRDTILPTCLVPAPVSMSCTGLPDGFSPSDTLQLQQLFGDATSNDNCSSYVQELPPVPGLSCNIGTITRRFRAVDQSGNISANVCQQIITLTADHDWRVRFPADADVYCGDAPLETITYEHFGCDLIAVNAQEEMLPPVGPELYRVQRTWRAVNWCQYDGVSDPFILGRDEDCDGQAGDGAVWAVFTNGQTYIDRDGDVSPGNSIPPASENICNGIDGYWRSDAYNGGLYEYTQMVNVYDNYAVDFAADSLYCIDSASCDLSLSIPVIFARCLDVDTLTGISAFLDEGNDGSLDQPVALVGQYPNLEAMLPGLGTGAYRLVVQYVDDNGNAFEKEVAFELRDCHIAPPACVNGSAIELLPFDIDGSGMVEGGEAGAIIFVNDFVSAPLSDCSNPVSWSINRSGDTPHIDSTSLLLTCADTGTLNIEIWAWDSAGNSSFCETYILVQDDLSFCDNNSLLSISGQVRRDNGVPVPDVNVSLTGGASQSAATGAAGFYQFNQLPAGLDYTITPFLDVGVPDCITVTDVAMASRHILGVPMLDNPYLLISADADNSQSITTSDVLALRDIALTKEQGLPGNTSWRFADAAHAFANPGNPWPFPEAINLSNLAGDLSGQDLIGMKIGDLNYCQMKSSQELIALSVQNANATVGGSLAVDILVDRAAEIQGLQFSLSWDAALLTFTGAGNYYTAPFSQHFYALPSGSGATFVAPGGGSFSGGERLFTLFFDVAANAPATTSVDITSFPTDTEATDNNLQPFSIGATGGMVTIGATPPGSDTLILQTSDYNVANESTLCVPITTENFINVVGMAFTLRYDPDVLKFEEVVNLNSNISGFNVPSNFGTPETGLSEGFITVNYFNNALNGFDLPDGSTIMEVCFTADSCGSECSDIRFTSDIAQIEFSDENQEVIPFQGNTGLVCIEGAPPANTVLQETLCPDESREVNGAIYDISNPSGLEVVPDANGCDSIVVEVDLTFLDAPEINLTDTICSGESYVVGDTAFTQSGTYTEVLDAANGCDSTVLLNLTVLPSPTMNLDSTLCPNGYIEVSNTIYNINNPSGTEILPAANGCDSTVHVGLNFYEPIVVDTAVAICLGESYVMGGASYTQSGDYTRTLTAATGCDSTIHLQLSVDAVNSPAGATNYTVCAGGPMPLLSVSVGAGETADWYSDVQGGSLLAQGVTSFIPPGPGTYFAEARNLASGCVSQQRLSITVLESTEPAPFSIDMQPTCNPAVAGPDTLFLSTPGGCDSLVITDYYFVPLDTTILSETTCQWEEVGEQTLELTSEEGCDSIVRLRLALRPDLITSFPTTVCDQSLVGVDTFFLMTAEGCDSLVILDRRLADPFVLPVDSAICEGQSIFFGGMELDATGTYYDTLMVAGDCDTILRLNLEVVATASSTLEDFFCEGGAYVYNDSLYTDTGQYVHTFQTAEGCDSLVTLILEEIPLPQVSVFDDEATLQAGQANAVLNLIANDNLPPVGAWAFEILDGPAHGSFVNNDPEQARYQLSDPEFLGEDAFTYRICSTVCPEACDMAAVRLSFKKDCRSIIEANLPTGFSPDGDNINDLYDPLGAVSSGCLQSPQNARIAIVNRWGEIVFEADPYRQWDGRHQSTGKLAPQGVYYCILQFELSEKEVIRKPVHVLRRR